MTLESQKLSAVALPVQQEREQLPDTGLFSNMPAAPFAVELMKPYPQMRLGRILIWLQGALVQIQKSTISGTEKWFISDFWHALGH